MPSARRRYRLAIGAMAGIVLALSLADRPREARAEPASPARHAFPPRGSTGRRAEGRAESSGGWWLGTAGIALALAAFGAVSLASRRYWPQGGAAGPLRIVGRTSLSPRHTVYLLRIGSRVLIVGAGTQGPPSLLGELTDPADIERLASTPTIPRPGDDA
jgi:flagellar protein FliO/FliZ